MRLVVPCKPSRELVSFQKLLGAKPAKFIERVAFDGCSFGNCYNNSRTVADIFGGQISLGWAVRIWKGVFLEAQQHAVWRDPEGYLRDVTPHELAELTTCFLECDTVTFDENGVATNINRYYDLAKGDDRKVAAQVIARSEELQRYQLEVKFVRDGQTEQFVDEVKMGRLVEELRSSVEFLECLQSQ